MLSTGLPTALSWSRPTINSYVMRAFNLVIWSDSVMEAMKQFLEYCVMEAMKQFLQYCWPVPRDIQMHNVLHIAYRPLQETHYC